MKIPARRVEYSLTESALFPLQAEPTHHVRVLAKGFSMEDEKQIRLEARARIDVRKLYERGEITLKEHASAIAYLRGVWFDHLSDIEIEDFLCREIRKLE
ncbi:MAG: hypothetical protein WBR14_19545, partial [Candidatus Acidiferrum sp.]